MVRDGFFNVLGQRDIVKYELCAFVLPQNELQFVYELQTYVYAHVHRLVHFSHYSFQS